MKFLSTLVSFFSRLFKRGARGNGPSGNVSDDNYPMF